MRCFELSALFVMVCIASLAQASPIVSSKNDPVLIEAPTNTPQARLHRDGIQAILDGKILIAKQKFEESLSLDPRYVPALVGLAGVAQVEGSPGRAVMRLEQAERSNPAAPEVHLGWGRYFLYKGDMTQARLAFHKAHSVAPKAIAPLLELGELALRQSQLTEALRAYHDAVAVDERNSFAQYGFGVALAAAGQRDDALTALKRAAALSPKDPAALRAIGRLHLEGGALAEAISAFDAALARQENNVLLMLDRAAALSRMARWDAAEAQLRKAQILAPRAAEVKLAMGDVNLGAGRRTLAEANYRDAIELSPKNPLAYNNLAWTILDRKDESGEAVRLAKLAVTLSPNSSPFYDTLGWAHRASGNLTGALASIKQAIKLEPGVGLYYFHLGVVQHEMKLLNDARMSLQRALELDHTMAQGAEARRLIRVLADG